MAELEDRRVRRSIVPRGRQWQNRYRAAVMALNNVAQLAKLSHVVAAVNPQAPPEVRILAGGDRLLSARRVGLLAGSFNPLTLAHVALGEAARVSASLDTVVWACTKVTVDKEHVERASLVDRLAHVQAYVRVHESDAVALLNRGLYVEQAEALRAVLAPGADLALVIGFDKVVQIFDPRYYSDRDAALRKLFSLARLLVAPRDGAGRRALTALVARSENKPFANRVSYVEVPARFAEDSSTLARERAASGRCTQTDLLDVLPPEGAALALDTGAYMASTVPELHDRYTWRTLWLRTLANLEPNLLRHAPPLSQLLDATVETAPRGRQIRDWLAGGTSEGVIPTGVVDLLARRPSTS